jgi:hypothetical protein
MIAHFSGRDSSSDSGSWTVIVRAKTMDSAIIKCQQYLISRGYPHLVGNMKGYEIAESNGVVYAELTGRTDDGGPNVPK